MSTHYHYDTGLSKPEELPSGDSADFTTTLPSDLIAQIVEKYFNKEMYRKPVRVVDLRMQGDMVMFSLAWITEKEASRPGIDYLLPGQALQGLPFRDEKYDPLVKEKKIRVRRETNGQFAKKDA